MKTVEFEAIELESAASALQHIDASGFGTAIVCDGKYLVVEETQAKRLESVGVRFAYVSECVMPDGSFRIVTVPIND